MGYCSPLLAGASTSHLSRLHAVETMIFRILGYSHDEAESLGLSLSHHRQVSGLSVFFCLLSGLASTALSAICPHHISAERSRSTNNPLLVKLPKSRITAHIHSFIPLFSHFWNKLPHPLQSHSSFQAFKTAVHHHLSSPIQTLIFSTPVNPPQTHLLQIPCFPF